MVALFEVIAMLALEIKLDLPDSLAQEAQNAGLLTPEAIEQLLLAEIRRRRVNRLFDIADNLAALDTPPMSIEEIEAEIQAARRGKRHGNAGRS